jgi:hypothetical protein
MDAPLFSPPASPAPPAAPAPERTLPLCHSATPPLSPEEETRFRAAARWPGDPFQLAENLGLPYSQLLRWLARPDIVALLDQHAALLARCEANRARHAQSEIAATLTADFQAADDPKERRRISTPLLRASTPARTTTRARAGASPHSGCHHPRAKPARGAADSEADPFNPTPTEPRSHASQPSTAPSGIPESLQPIHQRTVEARHAYCASRLPKEDLLQAIHEWDQARIAHASGSAGGPPPEPSPSHRLTVSPSHPKTPASHTVASLLAALRTFELSPKAAREALTSVMAPGFTYEEIPFDTALNQARIFRRASNHFNNGNPDPATLHFPDPPPAALHAATPDQPLTLARKVTIRRGQGPDGYCARHIFTLTRAGPSDPWRLQSIARPQGPP